MRNRPTARMFLAAAAAFAAIVPVSATVYRTNTVEGLMYLIKTYNGVSSSNVIELDPGDYFLPDIATYTNLNASWGSGLSTLYVENLRIRGMGATNAATRLIGAGNYRIACGAWNATFENLTITNGHSSAFEGAGNANRGGGVYGSCTLTNCLLIGNRSDGVGGSVHSSTKLYDCQVINNRASNGGGGHNITAWRTLFRGNVAAGDGGAVYTVTLYDCIVEGNTAGSNGGGGYNVTYATNTYFIGNTAASNGGGTGNHTTNADPANNVLVDCVISNNVSGGIGGGATMLSATNCLIACNVGSSGGGAYNCNLIGCTVRGNQGKSGGGIYFYPFASGKDFKPLVVSGCVIEHNICSNSAAHAYGGGVYYNSDGAVVHTVSNCIIRGNAAFSTPSTGRVGTGGGVGGLLSNLGDSQMIVDCDIHDNWADSYGGGIRSASVLRCRIYRNGGGSSGSGTYSCHLTDCDMAHATADYGWGLRTVYHDVGTPFTMEGNPYKSGTFTYYGVILYYPNCTNCLFRNNRATGYMLRGTASPNQSSSLVSCTVVSNSANYMFGYFAKAEYPLTLENCLFYDNFGKDGTTQCDLSIDMFDSSNPCNSNSVHLSHCAFRSDTVSSRQNFADWFDEGMYVLGADGLPATPRFAHAKDAEHPYCLRTSSPLLGLGKVQGWMADTTDVRGDGFPRLRDGKADIGCYQCWYPSVGTKLVFR